MPSPAQPDAPPDATVRDAARDADRADDLRLAFAAPLDRARATGLPLDRISLREHVREVEIGAFQQERGRRQRVRFDIVAEVTPSARAAISDDVDGILSYDTLIEAIETELDAERLNLLETLAERLAARVLLHERAARVFVRIEKLDLGPHVLGVEIVRARDDSAPPHADADAPRPHVLLMPAGAQRAPGLPALLDRLAAGAEPAVLIATPDFDPPRARHELPQRRLDLLALEQAAWRLADRDRRCIVVDSRTELDWSMRQRRLSIWAPARLVLDATHGPADLTPGTLARWFAEAFRASATTLPEALAGGFDASVTIYVLPLPARHATGPRLAGGWMRFDRAALLERGRPPEIVPAGDLPADRLDDLTAPRAAIAGLDPRRPSLMGILNVTPDSFSDGGRAATPEAVRARAEAMAAADILDVGGESTRPRATEVSAGEEAARVLPALAALAHCRLSIDTRKASVARAALEAGAALVNDVSALTFDPAMAATVARAGAPVCLMHAQGAPETMQDDPRYDDVALDVYDALAARMAEAGAAGIPRDRLIVDPGIGFGKTRAHNLTLLRRIALFHGLGVPVLLGASRKRFIGDIGGAVRADERMPGTLAVTLAGVAQGVQIHRVHDVAEVAQGLALWREAGGYDGPVWN